MFEQGRIDLVTTDEVGFDEQIADPFVFGQDFVNLLLADVAAFDKDIAEAFSLHVVVIAAEVDVFDNQFTIVFDEDEHVAYGVFATVAGENDVPTGIAVFGVEFFEVDDVGFVGDGTAGAEFGEFIKQLGDGGTVVHDVQRRTKADAVGGGLVFGDHLAGLCGCGCGCGNSGRSADATGQA